MKDTQKSKEIDTLNLNIPISVCLYDDKAMDENIGVAHFCSDANIIFNHIQRLCYFAQDGRMDSKEALEISGVLAQVGKGLMNYADIQYTNSQL